MRIVLVHNFYKVSGGEDTVFHNEAKLLKNHGHDVILYTKENESIDGFFGKIKAFFSCIFSLKIYLEFNEFLKNNRPDVVHVHNYFPIISPAIFICCKNNNIPVVHTLHNFRAICPSAILAHDAKIITKSISGSPFWCVLKRVYKKSYIGSFAVYLMVIFHRNFRTWHRYVDKFICLTPFSREIYAKAGWPVNKLVVKPNFTELVNFPEHSASAICEKNGAIFVGRLAEEKGIDLLLTAWKKLKYPLTIVGDGPLKPLVSNHQNCFIKYIGRKTPQEVLELIEKSAFIIMPSTCYETFGMVLIEAASVGTPAIVSKIGALQEVVIDGETGLHFEVGVVDDMLKKVEYMIENETFRLDCSAKATNIYKNKYSQIVNYNLLINIYLDAIEAVRHRRA